MNVVTRLEDTVLGWFKGVPHLPEGGRKWLGANVWWIVLIGAILSAFATLFAFTGLMGLLAIMGGAVPGASYYVVRTVTGVAIFAAVVSLVFLAAQAVLLGFAVYPLKERQKKGWVLLFASLLLQAVAVVVNAVVTFNVFGFITTIIFGAIFLAIGAYFVFEIHGQFAHVQKSKGVRGETEASKEAK